MTLRREAVLLLSGTKFERVARSAYNSWRDRLPAACLSADAARARVYDRQTIAIARMALFGGGGNSIDVGANCGTILNALVKLSPRGMHWAFEPIPNLAAQLRRRYRQVTVEQVALSDHTGIADFHFLPAASAYSSLLSRPEVEAGKDVQLIRVDVRRLDDVIPEEVPIAFIKIDTEGGEAAILRGAVRLLRRHKPVVVFECAPSALDECMVALEDAGLRLSLLPDLLEHRSRPVAEVRKLGLEGGEFYYAASGA